MCNVYVFQVAGCRKVGMQRLCFPTVFVVRGKKKLIGYVFKLYLLIEVRKFMEYVFGT